jgi:hypothetical protein
VPADAGGQTNASTEMPELHHQPNTDMERLLLNVLYKNGRIASLVVTGISPFLPKQSSFDLIATDAPCRFGQFVPA